MQVSAGTHSFRAVVIGESSVGKTCIVNRFIRNKFNSAEANTVGAIYETFTDTRNGNTFEVQIWDTAGQEKFRSLAPAYFRGSNAALAVFDMSKRSTFTCLESWISDFRTVAGESSVVIVVGNKADLTDHIQVSANEAKEWATARNMLFYEASAKTGMGVREIFQGLVDVLSKTPDADIQVEVERTQIKSLQNKRNCIC